MKKTRWEGEGGRGREKKQGGGRGKMKKTRWEGGLETKQGGGRGKKQDKEQETTRWEKSQRERKFRWIATPMHEVYVIFAACIFI